MVTTTGADNGAGQPLKSMVLTENVPEEFTVILCETWPVFQRQDCAAGTDSVTDSPWQKVVLPFAVITGAVGAG